MPEEVPWVLAVVGVTRAKRRHPVSAEDPLARTRSRATSCLREAEREFHRWLVVAGDDAGLQGVAEEKFGHRVTVPVVPRSPE